MAERVHPAVVIELGVEAAPRVWVCSKNDGEEARVLDWVNAHDDLAELVGRAFELAKEAHTT